MSSIPTRQIDGDVAVGRNVTMGGTGTVRGSLTVGHNLKVEGWLDAKNIKGPNKGLFKTAELLNGAYPEPKDGWWALVAVEGGASSDRLGQLYVAENGVWTAQTDSDGNPLLKGSPTVESTEFLEAVEEVKSDMEAVKEDLEQEKEDIKSLSGTQSSHTSSIGTLTTQMSAAQGDIANLKTGMETETAARKQADAAIEGKLNAEIAARKEADEAMAAEKGAAGGVAPLDDEGKVAEGYLADEWTGEVLEFAGTVSGVSVIGAGVTDTSGAAVYDTAAKIFVYALQGAGATGLATVKYYGYWPGADKYGKFEDGGMKEPYRGKLYVDTTTEKVYRWDGTSLVEVSGNRELEKKVETYISQNNELVRQTCKDLEIAEQDIDKLQGEIDALDKFAVMSEAEYEALSDKDDGTFYMITED